jgi:hypothetical protein
MPEISLCFWRLALKKYTEHKILACQGAQGQKAITAGKYL